MGEMRNAHKASVRKAEYKTSFRRPRRRCQNNIKMYLRETGLEGTDWIRMTQNRDRWRAVVNMIMNLGVP
jgi:hypothetical protein